MQVTPEKVISDTLKDTIISGSEIYISVQSSHKAIDIIAEMSYAIFRIELFSINMNGVKPFLNGICDIFPNGKIFEEFISYSSYEAKRFIDGFIELNQNAKNIFVNFTIDNSFD